MPKPTARYRFEHRLARWAEGLSRTLMGRRVAFFVGLRPDGSVRRIYWLPPGQELDADKKATLAQAYKHWFVYSPYPDSPESYLEWLELDAEVAAIWLDGALADDQLLDVSGEGALEEWPRGWRVIVG